MLREKRRIQRRRGKKQKTNDYISLQNEFYVRQELCPYTRKKMYLTPKYVAFCLLPSYACTSILRYTHTYIVFICCVLLRVCSFYWCTRTITREWFWDTTVKHTSNCAQDNMQKQKKQPARNIYYIVRFYSRW